MRSGTLRFDREVELAVADDATIGPIEGVALRELESNGILTAADEALIRTVQGYQHVEGKRLDEQRAGL